MAIYTQAEFAELTGKSNAHISVYASRGKIKRYKVDKVWMIDDKERVNIDFLKANKPKPEELKDHKIDKGPEKKVQKKVVDVPEVKDMTGQYELNLEKKNVEIEHKEVQTRLLLLKEARERGEQIPIQLVKDLISQLSHSIIHSYKESADRFLIDISHRTKMSSEDSAKAKGELVKIINEAHDKAINQCIKSFENAVINFKM